MQVAILHYHLHTGGVTRIIGSQIRGLSEADKKCEMVVLCGTGEGQESLFGVPVLEHPGLQYSKLERTGINYLNESAKIRGFIKKHAKGFILHCHNPNLGKNPALSLAIYQLAREGYRIVNHCHDFAEDRPRNMDALNAMVHETGLTTGSILYPDLPAYHFAVLNSCDHRRILNSAIPEDRVHLLPNPVAMESADPAKTSRENRDGIMNQLQLDRKKKICTYPVRAIRRKNLGEYLLLAELFKDSCQFLVTQPPQNPDELPGYIHWKEFSLQHDIGMKFEAGMIVNHEDLIRISDFCITTSSREGFGMVFLEPWLAGTPVAGRNLPCITADLMRYGMELPGLYDHILVQTEKGPADFKDLDPAEQEEFIIRIIQEPGEKDKLHRMNPFLASLFAGIKPGIMERNREIILNQFSVANYGKRLLALYKSLPG